MNILLGMVTLGSSQNWAIFRGHFYAFLGSFLKVKVQNVLKSMSLRMHFKPF